MRHCLQGMLPIHYAAFMSFVDDEGLEELLGYGSENARDDEASCCPPAVMLTLLL